MSFSFSFFFFFFIYFTWQLHYNIVMDFSIHQYESAVGIHVSPPSWTPCPPPFLPHPSRFFKQSQTKWFKAERQSQASYREEAEPPPLPPPPLLVPGPCPGVNLTLSEYSGLPAARTLATGSLPAWTASTRGCTNTPAPSPLRRDTEAWSALTTLICGPAGLNSSCPEQELYGFLPSLAHLPTPRTCVLGSSSQ